MLARLVDRLFAVEQWTVGVVTARPQAFLEPDFRPHVRWYEPPTGDSLADPFILTATAQTVTLLCERWTSIGGRGRIVHGTAVDGTLGLEEAHREPHHLSYPFVVRDGNVTYCVPERHESGELALYRVDDRGWHREHILLTLAAVDATLFEHDGRWWIFTGDQTRLPNVNLFAYHADTLAGPWVPHARNPIKTDVRSARGAGVPFRAEAGLIRPSQDCSQTYGGALAFNRIERLDPTEFFETVVGRFDPARLDGSWDACHTLSFAGDICALDARRTRFDVRLPLRRLAARLRRQASR
ncbi:MAG: hypothetical protein NVS2B8_09740 [Vulcanimicrobiaceae bacterium]